MRRLKDAAANATTPTSAHMANAGFRLGGQLRRTVHPLPFGIRRRTEHVRAQVVAAHACSELDRNATIGWHRATSLPLTDGGRPNSKDFSQALLRPGCPNSSIDRGNGVHEPAS